MKNVINLIREMPRRRRTVLIAVRQGKYALAILQVRTGGGEVHYEVLNSMHAGRQPMIQTDFERALRYVFQPEPDSPLRELAWTNARRASAR